MYLGISLPSEWCGCILNYRDFILSIENSLEYMPLCTIDRSDGKYISLWVESKGSVFNLYLSDYVLLDEDISLNVGKLSLCEFYGVKSFIVWLFDRLVCDYGIKIIDLRFGFLLYYLYNRCVS